jgi:hypothetical protein
MCARVVLLICAGAAFGVQCLVAGGARGGGYVLC